MADRQIFQLNRDTTPARTDLISKQDAAGAAEAEGSTLAQVLALTLAADVSVAPTGGISATNVQAAIAEIDSEKASIASPTFTGVPAAPTAAPGANTTQLATTAYVDAGLALSVAGLSFKNSVRVATTAAATLATGFENGDTIDGVVLATGNRVLIKNQAAPAENGLYTVNASGAPTRSTDADAWAELVAAYVFVEQGTVGADTSWVCQANAGGTLGTTAVTWAQHGAGGSGVASSIVFTPTGGVAATNVQTAIAELEAEKANLAGPTFTGVPAAPTAATTTNTTQLATTAFVQTELAAVGNHAFRTVAVSGQSDVVADSAADTLTLVAGANVTLTTSAAGDSVTIASTGGGGGPSGLSTQSFSFQLTDAPTDEITVADAQGTLLITASMNGWNLTSAIARVVTAGTTNPTTFQVRRNRGGTIVDMLSTVASIASAATSSTGGVINTANDDVATGDIIYVDVKTASVTKPKGALLAIELAPAVAVTTTTYVESFQLTDLITDDMIVGDGQATFLVTSALSGKNLISGLFRVVTAGTTNPTTVQVRRDRGGTVVDMLSAVLSIASGATTSTGGTVNTSNDDLLTGDLLMIDVKAASTTKPKGGAVGLEFA